MPTPCINNNCFIIFSWSRPGSSPGSWSSYQIQLAALRVPGHLPPYPGWDGRVGGLGHLRGQICFEFVTSEDGEQPFRLGHVNKLQVTSLGGEEKQNQ
jgi:hypothetical protein